MARKKKKCKLMLTSKNRCNIFNIYDKQKANFPPKKHRKHINQFKKREREVDNPMGKKGKRYEQANKR